MHFYSYRKNVAALVVLDGCNVSKRVRTYMSGLGYLQEYRSQSRFDDHQTTDDDLSLDLGFCIRAVQCCETVKKTSMFETLRQIRNA